MTFLRNTWYCAGWSDEIAFQPLSRTILGEPVLFYRKEDGSPVAIGNRCPHRFAPLHLGKRRGDCIQCPYHGLVFGADGRCVANPHGDGSIPKAARVAAFPVVENQGVVWIWMGTPELANPDAIIDLGEVDGRAGWTTVRGQLMVKAHYELIVDNLLDLSHVPYLHPFLSAAEAPPEGFRVENELRTEGDTVWAMAWNFNCPLTPFIRLLWDDAPPTATLRAHMRWNAPSVLYLDTGMAPGKAGEGDGERAAGASIPSVHLLTPETEHSTHYFWALARDRKLDDQAVSAAIQENVTKAFVEEDEAMVEACAAMMGTTDLMSLKPVLLPGDAAAVRARRTLQKLIAAQLPQHPPRDDSSAF